MIKNLLPNCLLLAIMALVYTSCKKDNTGSKNLGPAFPSTPAYHLNMPDSADKNPSVSATLKVNATSAGSTVPTDFLGYSFEMQIMTDTTYFNAANTTFINMFKNLNGGLIRIGGSTVDRTFWSNGRRTSSVSDSIYTNDVSRFKSFAQSVGWKTIWGLNLGTGNTNDAAAEAQYVNKNLGGQIASFAIGNEPAYLYVSGLRTPSYSNSQYLAEFNSFSQVVKGNVPNVSFSGPENQYNAWGLSFMQSVNAGLNMLTIHYYMMGPAGTPNITMDRLMTFDPGLREQITGAASEAQDLKLPFRITECNSVYGGGQPGMSNAYAAALWGSEFMFYCAQQGAAGINFHTGPTPNYVYSPIGTQNGKSVARPLYYAMLMFNQANIRQFVNSDLTNIYHLNIDTYSFVTRDNKKGIMIINKDATANLSLTVNTTDAIGTATAYELTGPGLTSLTGTSINGTTVSDDGTFAANGVMFNLNKKYSSVLVKVKPISAMLVVMD